MPACKTTYMYICIYAHMYVCMYVCVYVSLQPIRQAAFKVKIHVHNWAVLENNLKDTIFWIEFRLFESFEALFAVFR